MKDMVINEYSTKRNRERVLRLMSENHILSSKGGLPFLRNENPRSERRQCQSFMFITPSFHLRRARRRMMDAGCLP
ncbi:unnamed protein product [Cuscuta epithymum]|uniref:Uncharacterized protein n=1 Tax=Cuscuta epithymum TaxID=186058 RepID=A0AAV0D1M9_9ASTE|nr:unnamed protein product [Cuscuta epithymum]